MISVSFLTNLVQNLRYSLEGDRPSQTNSQTLSGL